MPRVATLNKTVLKIEFKGMKTLVLKAASEYNISPSAYCRVAIREKLKRDGLKPPREEK
jgi:hypothetical protein